jgi:1,4-alpha-glucan branching enzyme
MLEETTLTVDKTLDVIPFSLLTDLDIHLFREGTHYRLYEKLGAHVVNKDGVEGTYFAVWAPNANFVSVVGDFNNWQPFSHKLHHRWDGSGIWEGFIPEITTGSVYKYYIESKFNNYKVQKADPFGNHAEVAPNTASVVWKEGYKWKDTKWMKERKKVQDLSKPYSVYEVHLGSWKRVPEEGNRSLSYREMAQQLPKYVKELGFTHVEFLPVMEHPFFGSWGYQITGYFAPSSRYGNPDDFAHLIDELHKEGIGVILDWVPSHFPSDEHGLVYFDGTHLFEHADPRKGFHPDWQSYIFNYGRNEVKCFLISNALYWLEKYHIDGLRVDAVASMLYLDYSRKEGEWIPNEFGGRENLEAISFLRTFNEAVYKEFPDVHTIAEESTSWPMVSKPTSIGGLGFGMKWMMGWMHDTLDYMSKDPAFRKYHQNQLTFSMHYVYSENFMMPLSHDEVVHGKGSLINKMPGDEWQKFANLRLLYGYMFTHPGAKLLFMGCEIAQFSEWAHDRSIDWHLLYGGYHNGVQNLLRELNKLYTEEKALHELQFVPEGFEWIDASDYENSVIAFLRKGKKKSDVLLVVCNFTPVVRHNYRIGVPSKGTWTEILNTDAHVFGGSGVLNGLPVEAVNVEAHGREWSIEVNLAPLGVGVLENIS